MTSLNIIELVQLPFAQRIILGGILVALSAAMIGFFVSLRKEHFFGETIAHSALTGIALGILLGFNPFAIALIYSLLISLALPWIQQKTKLEMSNLLGIVLPTSTALGVILFSQSSGYQPELVSFLFGSIAWISWTDVHYLGILSVILGIIIYLTWSKLTIISIDPQYSRLLGIKTRWYELLYNFLLALVIIAGVRLVGIVLVNALLIVPTSAAKIISGSLQKMFWLGLLFSLVSVFIGLVASFTLNWPSGATIALASGLTFILAANIRALGFGNFKSP